MVVEVFVDVVVLVVVEMSLGRILGGRVGVVGEDVFGDGGVGEELDGDEV